MAHPTIDIDSLYGKSPPLALQSSEEGYTVLCMEYEERQDR